MKQIASLFLLILTPFVNFSQISSGKVEDLSKPVETKPAKEQKAKKGRAPKDKYVPDEGTNDFTFFLGTSYGINSNRLKENDNLFGKPIGIRAEEKVKNTWNYQFGVRNRLNRFLSLEVGLSFNEYASEYAGFLPAENLDGNYTRRVRTLSLPIQLYYTYGKRVQLLAGIGVVPFIPTKKIIETTIVQPNGPFHERVRTMQGLNSFGFAVGASVGVQYRFWRYGSLYFIPGYTMNLTNVYGKQEPHKEWFNSLDLRFGLAVHLPQKKKD